MERWSIEIGPIMASVIENAELHLQHCYGAILFRVNEMGVNEMGVNDEMGVSWNVMGVSWKYLSCNTGVYSHIWESADVSKGVNNIDPI